MASSCCARVLCGGLVRDRVVLCRALCGAWAVAGIEYGIGLQNHCICMVRKGFCWGRGTIIIAKSMHLYGLGKWIRGRGTRNHCKIYTFVLFWKLVWGGGARESFQKQCICMVLGGGWGGAPESLQNQCMCMVLEGWLGERRTRLIAKSMHLQGFGRLIGGAENHYKINIFV